MDTSLAKRIDSIKEKLEYFDISSRKLAKSANRSHVTISYLLNGSDDRYITETNVQAIEEGIEKILDKYREKLCKPGSS